MTENNTVASPVASPVESSVSLRFRSEFSLPSQDGKRGRPRSRGRVYIEAIDNACPLPFEASRRAVAAHYGVKLSDVARYAHEELPGMLWVFIVPGIDKNTGIAFEGTVGSF